ncbi:uncharacterized protein DUF397 [Herbihabitans rhizosphaerae]|uniref:Uncharacterized protein DUF397 n=1 Tax=Herbihabitans rhizosphaerae TaxID=1872711 RepID=A0A4Q7KSB9_9PSEU|nr:DUF397 domain-containing protein [Herbihabitans rhizosphaerae]RZS39326.1 uncharacterized protein DUF397 [Herbihabitans rhizosphaerae]
MVGQTPVAGRRTGWFKSSYSASNGHCVEVNFMTGAEWFKSSFSETNGHCVEVRFGDPVTGVRDSKNPGGSVLAFTRPAWTDLRTHLTRRARERHRRRM